MLRWGSARGGRSATLRHLAGRVGRSGLDLKRGVESRRQAGKPEGARGAQARPGRGAAGTVTCGPSVYGRKHSRLDVAAATGEILGTAVLRGRWRAAPGPPHLPMLDIPPLDPGPCHSPSSPCGTAIQPWSDVSSRPFRATP